MNDIKELKARAYDLAGQIQYLQTELQKLNNEIAEKIQAEDNKKTVNK